jgi:ribose transport system permease protein
MKFWRTREFGTAFVLAGMLVACEIAAQVNAGRSFLASDGLVRVFRDCSFVGIAAIGACAVIISGGVDLSSGSIMGLAAVTLAHLYVNQGWPAWLAILAGTLQGGVLGLVNGALVGVGKLPPFIATLGMLSIARGISYWVTGGLTISLDWEARGETSLLVRLLGDQSFWVMVGMGVAGALLLSRFRWGRYVYAVGGNEEAARFSGVRIGAVKTGLYAVAGLFSALAGCAYALRYGSAYVAVGSGYELQIIAACAIGGVSFSGGQGSVPGALLGAAVLQVLRELLIQVRVKADYIDIAYGAVILLAVGIDQLRQGGTLGKWFGRKTA